MMQFQAMPFEGTRYNPNSDRDEVFGFFASEAATIAAGNRRGYERVRARRAR